MSRRIGFFLLVLLIAVPAWGQDFVYFKKKAAAAGAGTTNYCSDAAAQLCLYMNNDGGNETDRTANAYTFTQSASDNIPTSATVPTGYAGTSRDFEVVDTEYLTCTEANCPDLNISGADAKISLVAWVNPEAVAGTTEQMIVNKYVVTSQRSYLMSIIPAADTYKFSCIISNDGTDVTGTVYTDTTNYSVGAWHHVACVSNDVDVRLYVDGVLDSTPVAHTTGIFDSTANINIGTYAASSNYFDGLMDEVAIFSRDLSSTEVLDIKTNGISGDKGGSD